MFGQLLLFSIFLLSEIRLRASPLGPWSHQQQLCMCLNGEEEDISINVDLRNGNIFHSDVINCEAQGKGRAKGRNEEVSVLRTECV